MIFLDSDIIIDVLRDYLPAIVWLESLETGLTVCVPGYVVLEALNGCRNAAEARKVGQLVNRFNIRWAPEYACDEALRHYADHRLQYGIGVIDAMIATTVTAHGGTLHTFNRKHYQAIKELDTVQPYVKG